MFSLGLGEKMGIWEGLGGYTVVYEGGGMGRGPRVKKGGNGAKVNTLV